jgi:hypothetical protein
MGCAERDVGCDVWKSAPVELLVRFSFFRVSPIAPQTGVV